jgi:ribose transport system substrate-binding protein
MRVTSRSGVFAGIAALSLVLAACSSDTDGASASGGGGDCEYNIGYAEPAASQEIDSTQDAAMIAAGEQLGICVTVLDAALDVNKQLQDVNQFIAQDMDAILVFPLSQDSLNPALERAREQGIKVIGLNALVTDEQPSGDIGPYDALYDQNTAVGGATMLADYVKENAPEGGNALGIDIGVPVPSLNFMVDNYEDFVTADGAMNWLGQVDNASDDIAGAQQIVGEAVTRFQGEQIDAVLAYNTASAVGASQALRGSPSEDAIIVGQNGDSIGVEGIRSGQIDAMTDLLPWKQGLVLLDLTQRVLEGGDYPKVTFFRVEMYTQENIDERRDWDEAVEQIASGELTCENADCPTEEETLTPL